jgi:hypothetical protein
MEARNRAWFALPPTAREKAVVYTLGLFIYTVFEGLSNVQRSVANKFPIEPEMEYPNFKRTPTGIRKLIQHCTADVPDWQAVGLLSEPWRVGRVNGLLYPAAQTNLQPNTRTTFDTVMGSLLRFWNIELARAEKFLHIPEWETGDFGRSRPSLRDVVDALGCSLEGMNR